MRERRGKARGGGEEAGAGGGGSFNYTEKNNDLIKLSENKQIQIGSVKGEHLPKAEKKKIDKKKGKKEKKKGKKVLTKARRPSPTEPLVAHAAAASRHFSLLIYSSNKLPLHDTYLKNVISLSHTTTKNTHTHTKRIKQ